MTRYKAKANNEITRRITSLQGIISKIKSAKHFTESQKSTFALQIQTEIANLTALKAKIDADTDMAALRADVQSVTKSYRVYALYIPKIHSLGAVDEVLNAADRMSKFIPKLQSKITEAQAAGKDVTALNLALADMQNKIADAKTQAQNAQNVLMSLAPEGYPGNKTSFESAKATLQTARQDLKTAREDGSAILSGLRAFGPKAVRAPSTSPSISPAPSVAQ